MKSPGTPARTLTAGARERSLPGAPARESWLAAISAHLVEACWLLAAGLVPVLGDPHSNSGFEVMKAAAIQTLGLITTGALLIHALARTRPAGDLTSGTLRRRATPAAIFLGGLAAVIVFSTAISLNPHASLWGGRLTYQGSFSLLALLLLSASVALHLRTYAQLDRLLTVTLLTGFPVAIYALLQRWGLDPLMTRTADGLATSFAGQPVYLAGYLVMLLPLGIWRVWSVLGKSRSAWPLFWGMLLVALLGAFFATEKRGPFIALISAATCGSLLLAAYSQRRRLAYWGLGLAAGVGLALVGLAALGKAGVPLASVPVVRKLAMIIPLGGETGDVYRRTLWAKAPETLLPAQPFLLPDGSKDPWSRWRILFGHGPETFDALIARHTPFPHSTGFPTRDERFHNGFWDTWQSLGWFGLATSLGLMLCVFGACYARLGLLPGKHPTLRLGAISLLSAAGGAGALAWLYGAGYLGLGIHLGFAAGLAVTPLWFATRLAPDRPDRFRDVDLLTIALLAALVAHHVDMAFLYPTGSTSMLSWILLGAAAAVGWRHHTRGCEDQPASNHSLLNVDDRVATGANPGVLAGFLSGAVLIGMLHTFIHFYSGEATGLGEVLHASLTRIRFVEGPSHLLPLLFVPSWLVLNAGLVSRLRGPSPEKGAPGQFLVASALSFVLASGYALVKASAIVRVGPLNFSVRGEGPALAQLAAIEALSTLFLVLLMLLAGGAAYLIFRMTQKSPTLHPGWLPSCLAALVALAVGGAIWSATHKTLWKENCILWGRILYGNGFARGAAVAYQRALDQAPEFSPVRITLAETLVFLATRTPDSQESERDLARAAAVLQAGRAWSELNDANYFLGSLHLEWSLRERRPDLPQARASLAQEAFARAVVFAPDYEPAWFGAAVTARILGESASAEMKLARADAITAEADAAVWGDFYAAKTLATSEPTLREMHLQRAIHYLDRSIASAGEGRPLALVDPKLLRVLVQKGTLLRNSGRLDEAVACFQAAMNAEPGVETWEAVTLLAFTLADLGDIENALTQAARAMSAAPPEVQRQLSRLTADLRRSEGKRP